MCDSSIISKPDNQRRGAVLLNLILFYGVLLGCLFFLSCGRSLETTNKNVVVDASVLPDTVADVTVTDASLSDGELKLDAVMELDASLPTKDVADEITPDDTIQPEDTTPPDAQVDSLGGADANAAGDLVDVGLDTRSDVTTCKDWRKRGDNKVPSDLCWKPPQHYCSSPWEAGAVWFGCASDFSVCCVFGSLCHQCDWIPCPVLGSSDPMPAWAHPKCPKNSKALFGPSLAAPCKKYLPNYTEKFCWDGAPASWSEESKHSQDNKNTP